MAFSGGIEKPGWTPPGKTWCSVFVNYLVNSSRSQSR